ncbi:MAG: S8 family serine peptidase [Lachnospiraceae bacterium]|nr:S8 family serine peptidase [Lachnospiraceae bacterium]
MLDLIVRYTGDLRRLAEEIGFIAEELLGGYAIVRIRQELAPLLLSAEEILWTEVPSRVYTEVAGGRRAACVTALQAQNPELTGRGVLVAMIDSGIDYTHPDFRNPDGTTRIAALWDQTAEKKRYVDAPPEGYLDGVLYTRERINAALRGERTESGESLVPETDLSGHGTHVAGIAAGNGRASGGRYRGVAYESNLLVVKLGGTQSDPFPQTTNLMTAVDFCIRYAAKAEQPISINLSFGNNAGAHDGKSLLETYLDEVSLYGKTCICIGTGNNAALGWHVGGVAEGEREILLSVGPSERNIRMGLWLSALDTFKAILVSPSGTARELPVDSEGTEKGTESKPVGGIAVKGYPVAVGTVLSFGTSAAEVFIGEATPYRILREIGITLRTDSGSVEEGIWRLRLRPVRILDGGYDSWLIGGVQSPATRFLQATAERTLTVPSTASRPIAVAAYDGRTDSITSFSGRGYPRGSMGEGNIKPDLAAPGVEIISCAPGGGYTTKTGTSMATPFVTGCGALLMQWGIVEGNDPYLYGERLKAFLIRGTNPLAGFTDVPNPYVGWGTICVEKSYRLLVGKGVNR